MRAGWYSTDRLAFCAMFERFRVGITTSAEVYRGVVIRPPSPLSPCVKEFVEANGYTHEVRDDEALVRTL